MKKETLHNGWELDFHFPLEAGGKKPRIKGITMILDKGIGLRETLDLLEMCAEYIDFWKLSFGSSALYKPEILKSKIEMVNSFHIKTYPGGTFAEIAIIQGKLKAYLKRAHELGFTAMEISDGTIQMPSRQRSKAIKMAVKTGFSVLTEIGKKTGGEIFHPELMGEQVGKDLEDGAFKVILEARESGKGVTIFNNDGNIEQEKMNRLLLSLSGQEHIIWEAPLKKQQVDFITIFGPSVNLGNILPDDVISLQSLRAGLRADTFKLSLEQNEQYQMKIPS